MRVLPAARGRFLFAASGRPHHQPETRRGVGSGQSRVCLPEMQRVEGERHRFLGRSHRGQFVRLFNPRRERWDVHFAIRGAVIDPLTPEGEATARLLKLNLDKRVVERQMLSVAGRYPR